MEWRITLPLQELQVFSAILNEDGSFKLEKEN